MASLTVIKVLIAWAASATFAILWAPILSYLLYKYKLWRAEPRKKTIDGLPAEVFSSITNQYVRKVPRLGGVLIWLTVVFIIFLFSLLAYLFPSSFFQKLNFLSRNQTWLPLGMLVAASLLGLGDDLLQIFRKGKDPGGGMRFTRRLILVFLIGAIGAWWFYFKLGWSNIHIPGNGNFEIGIWYLPLFVITVLACWSGGVIDGLDGLAGGVFSIMFAAFSVIAFSNMQYDLAAFCAALVGSILAFLWFNIPPARFYMGETGVIGLTTTLAVVAFLTNSLLVLPIIGGLLVIESGSVIVQLVSKRFFGRKIFLCAPIHHHFQAKGWPPEKITMRFWILGMILAVLGLIIRLLG